MEPLKLAVVGAGRRAWGVYFEILPRLAEFFQPVAVCDRLAESADRAAEHLGVAAFHGLRELLDARCAEAAVLVTPFESHHALSVFCSRAGVHHVCETPMAPTLRQCREMADEADGNGVVLHVNEQFHRLPLIAFTRQVIRTGVLGPVGRITCFHGHTGYHSNSIWQFYGAGPPVAVNAVTHTMAVRRHLDGAGRWQEAEPFRVRVLHFADGLLGVDLAGNIKSALGRCPRPGYLEIDGECGALVAQPYDDRPAPWNGRAEVRLVAEEDYPRGGYAESFPIERETLVGHRVNYSDQIPHGADYNALRCRLGDRMPRWENPTLRWGITSGYLSAVAQGLLEFHRRVREGAEPEYRVAHAVASAEMEVAFARSAELNGGGVELTMADDPDRERAVLDRLRRRFGVDPLDVEAMIDVAFPKNYVPETDYDAASPDRTRHSGRPGRGL